MWICFTRSYNRALSASMFVRSLAEIKMQLSCILFIQVRFSSSRSIFSRVRGVRSSSSFGTKVKASILLNTIIIGFSVLSISAKVRFTTSICSSNVGWEISTTCTNKSASRTSSRVDLKDSTSSVGNLRIKPTVSDSRKGRLSRL